MVWIRQKPRSTVKLADAPGLFRTTAPRILAQGYAGLMRDGGGAVPRKAGLDISRFTTALTNIVLFAVIKPDQCIYRIVGETWKQRIGMNPTGRNYLDFVARERRESAVASVLDLIDVPSAFRVIIEQHYAAGKTAMLEVLAVPLLSDEPGIDGFTIFAAQLVAPIYFGNDEDRMVLGANVVERDLIDIGFGVNEDFVDLVRPS